MFKELSVLALLLPISAGCEPVGYVLDSNKEIVRDNELECVHTSSWLPEYSITGCDGIEVIGISAQQAIDSQRDIYITQHKDEIKSAVTDAINDKVDYKSPVISHGELTILFSLNSSLLKAQYWSLLQRIPKGSAIALSGYTDQYGTDRYNIYLSLQRVISVRDYLLNNGYNPSSIKGTGLGKDTNTSNSSDPIINASNLNLSTSTTRLNNS